MNKLCQPTYLEIRRSSSVRQHLSVEATKTLLSSLALSRLDYCNALLAGSPQVLLDKLQRVINCSARLICKILYLPTSLLYEIHLPPISSQIQCKIFLICFHVVSGTGPPYLSELLHPYSPSRSLRSFEDTLSSVFLGWTGGPWGRDPFNTSGL